jgi:hypothetical protein
LFHVTFLISQALDNDNDNYDYDYDDDDDDDDDNDDYDYDNYDDYDDYDDGDITILPINDKLLMVLHGSAINGLIL